MPIQNETTTSSSTSNLAVSRPRIAFLGLGAMGTRMVHRLLAAGYPVSVFNRTRARSEPVVRGGAHAYATPAEAVRGADVVITMLTDDDSSRAVWTGDAGALSAIGLDTLCIESSTLSPRWVSALARNVSAAGGTFLDAPVAGSRPQAEAGALIYLVGGDAADVNRAEPILRTMGQKVVHAGPIGHGVRLKLAVNAMFAAQIAAFGEVIYLLEAGGFSRDAAIGLLSGMPVVAPALAGVATLMQREVYTPMFPVALVEKDLRYAVQSAASAPLLEAVRARYADAVSRGLGEENIHAVTKR